MKEQMNSITKMLDEVQLQFEKEQTLRTGSNRDNKFYRKPNIQKNYSDGKFKVDDDSKKIEHRMTTGFNNDIIINHNYDSYF